MNNLSLKIRLIAMNFLIYAVWGTYLSSLGIYLGNIGMGTNIGAFFALQGIVSLFMPALMGIVADKWIPAQKLLGICQGLAGIFMGMAGFMGMTYGPDVTFAQLFPFYAVSVAFFMPTVALGISVSYNALERNGLDTMSTYPPIRVFGTIGFIVSMWIVDLTDFKSDYRQLLVSAAWSLVLAAYAFTLPACPTSSGKRSTSIVEALGLRAFTLFGNRQMRQFFIFSFLLGMCLQVTFGFSGTFMSDFGRTPEFADAFAVRHNVLLSSLSQISETLCILLIPFFLKRLGIKKVMLIAMFAWMCRFGFFGLGNPEGGVWLFVLSMIVYGVAFDFFQHQRLAFRGPKHYRRHPLECARSVYDDDQWTWCNCRLVGGATGCKPLCLHTISRRYVVRYDARLVDSLVRFCRICTGGCNSIRYHL